MNTLSRAVTARFFPDTAAYLALRAHWCALLHGSAKHELTAAHHLLYAALRGNDWRTGFTPITNPRKLANGAFYGWALFRALGVLHNRGDEAGLLAPFAGLVSPAMLDQVRGLVPSPNPYAYQAAAFTRRDFPFAAYAESAALPVPVAENRPRA